mmetsp:Transcript_83029/g.189657  ORF Transcript_83029/g.189657 Transcript_83029/m.189657 type:complete len:285 (-) Transcript_83029:247-1101(-)
MLGIFQWRPSEFPVASDALLTEANGCDLAPPLELKTIKAEEVKKQLANALPIRHRLEHSFCLLCRQELQIPRHIIRVSQLLQGRKNSFSLQEVHHKQRPRVRRKETLLGTAQSIGAGPFLDRHHHWVHARIEEGILLQQCRIRHAQGVTNADVAADLCGHVHQHHNWHLGMRNRLDQSEERAGFARIVPHLFDNSAFQCFLVNLQVFADIVFFEKIDANVQVARPLAKSGGSRSEKMKLEIRTFHTVDSQGHPNQLIHVVVNRSPRIIVLRSSCDRIGVLLHHV